MSGGYSSWDSAGRNNDYPLINGWRRTLAHWLLFGFHAVRIEAFMSSDDIVTSSWSTASHADAAETEPMALSTLGEHLEVCSVSHGRMFALRCFAETTVGFVAAHFVTVLVLVALLIGVGSLVL
jgi:hypothetical protein